MYLFLLAIALGGGILVGVSVNKLRHRENPGYALLGIVVGLAVVAAAYFTAVR